MSLIDQIYKPIESDIGATIYNESDSEIGQYFAGRNLFITGVTGYLGKCLLEKLLRSCPKVKHIYVMMRERSKGSLKDQAKKYFENEVFGPLKRKYPNFQEKVTVLKGDLMAENLGLSDEDRRTIMKNVNVIYHNAANVKFDIKVSMSLKVNVLGTKQMLELARECENLDLFVYVSTAYSHCYRKDIREEFYAAPADLKTVYKTIEADEKLETGLSEEALKVLIGDHPNIYTYTKAIAEDLVRQYALNSKVPHAIYRPSIVISAFKEPLAGWCGNTNGPVYIFLAGALGYIHTAYHHGHLMDFIPSDLTVNALLAITWDAHNQWKNHQRQALIYNYGSSTTNPTSLLHVHDLYDRTTPPMERSTKAVSLNFIASTSSLWLFYTLHMLLHFIPACLLDTVLILSGKKPRAVSIFWKATQHLDKIDYFGNGNWRINMPRTLEVIDKMSPTDNEIFFCDIRVLSWEEQCTNMWRGFKHYTLKEDIVSPAGRRKYYLLCCIHYGFCAILALSFCYFLFKLGTIIFKIFFSTTFDYNTFTKFVNYCYHIYNFHVCNSTFFILQPYKKY